MDGVVVLVTALIAAGTGLLFGIAPALAAGRADPQEWLKVGYSAGVTSGRSHPRRALVVLQLAAAVVLTIGAALLAKSFVRFQAIDRGFDPAGVLTASVSLERTRYPEAGTRRALFDTIVERLRALPHIDSAATSSTGLGEMSMTMNWHPSRGSSAGDATEIVFATGVGPDFFRSFGIPIRAGGECSDRVAGPAAVVNEQMMRLAFPDRAATGARLDFGLQGTFDVVGVAANVRQMGSNALPPPTVYVCASRTEAPLSTSIVVRARGSVEPTVLAASVREAVRASDPAQPVTRIVTGDEMVANAMTTRWFEAALVVAFAGIALLLAMFGLYAVIAYLVELRTHEIGVRVALGATRADILGLVLRQGGVLTAIGIVLGVIAAIPLVRLIRGILFEVEMLDASIFVSIAVLLAIVALIASLIPARRATRVDPLVALRCD